MLTGKLVSRRSAAVLASLAASGLALDAQLTPTTSGSASRRGIRAIGRFRRPEKGYLFPRSSEKRSMESSASLRI